MKLIVYTSLVIFLLVSIEASADLMQDVKILQHRWAEVNYNLKDKEQEKAFEALMEQANKLVNENPDRAEILIWRGIIESGFAGAKGGLGALSLAKAAKADFEKALSLDDEALSGSAYTSLGTLYFRVPGWPIGFGSDKKAEKLLIKALTINPDGIDSNYFYGLFLLEHNKLAESKEYLLKARNAPARADRPLADKGRQQEIEQALIQVNDRQHSKTYANSIN
jgi:tetratricopeptide (TPR) repeat protein